MKGVWKDFDNHAMYLVNVHLYPSHEMINPTYKYQYIDWFSLIVAFVTTTSEYTQQKTHWELGEQHGNTSKPFWERDGNTYHPPPSTPQKKKS
jgi:hypothetical protein